MQEAAWHYLHWINPYRSLADHVQRMTSCSIFNTKCYAIFHEKI